MMKITRNNLEQLPKIQKNWVIFKTVYKNLKEKKVMMKNIYMQIKLNCYLKYPLFKNTK